MNSETELVSEETLKEKRETKKFDKMIDEAEPPICKKCGIELTYEEFKSGNLCVQCV